MSAWTILRFSLCRFVLSTIRLHNSNASLSNNIRHANTVSFDCTSLLFINLLHVFDTRKNTQTNYRDIRDQKSNEAASNFLPRTKDKWLHSKGGYLPYGSRKPPSHKNNIVQPCLVWVCDLALISNTLLQVSLQFRTTYHGTISHVTQQTVTG